jgi:hypothetical protein
MLAAEQRLAMSLDMSMPTMPPTQLALDAITQSELERRKSAGRWIRRALAFVAGLILVLFLRSDRGESLVRPDNFRRQSVELHCISTQAAVELATPILRSSSARIYTVRDLSLVTVEGLDPEVSEALALIASMDNPSRCTTLPHPSAAPIIPSGEGQGKD